MDGTSGEQERFWAKVERTDSCWLWTAAVVGPAEHGSFRVGGRAGRSVLAHRYAYELLVGPIPDGHEIHHTCEVPRCVNPEHLVAMTRAWHAAQHHATHCSRGHPFDLANTYYYRGGGRRCRKCHAMRQRGYPRWKPA